jgi:hypothetical protein
MSEHEEQVALFEWAEMSMSMYPELENMFAIPNGGKRNVTVARKLKDEGVKAGVLDVLLAVPNHKYHGLWIEMKYGKNKLSELQLIWKERLEKYGYKVVVCYFWYDAVEEIKKYLEHRDD